MIRKGINSIADRPNLQRALKGFSYFFSEKMTRVLVGFILQTWIARHLGPERMGVYAYIADFVAVFIPIALFGFDDILVKEFVSRKDDGKVLGTILYFRLFVSIPIWILLCVSIWIIRREASDIVYITVAYGTMLFVRCLDTYYSYFHAHFLAKQLVKGRQAAYLIASVVRAGGLFYGAGLIFFLANTYFQYALERITAVLQIRKSLKDPISFDFDYLKKLLPLATPIAFTSFFSYAETRMGTFFLNKFWNLETVGEFGVGRSLLDLWDFLPTTICLTAFPVVLMAKEKDFEQYESKLRKLYAFLFYLGTAFAISLSLAAPYVIKILYGQKYDQTVNVLTYGSWLAVVTYINFARVKWYIMEERTTDWLVICLLVFFLNFGFQFYFTKEFGITGPYFASIAAHVVANGLAAIIYRSVRVDLVNVFQGVLFPFKLIFRR